MDRVNVDRLVWWAHRSYQRHGAVAVVAVSGLLLLAGVLLATGIAYLRLQDTQVELDQRVAALRTQAQPQAPRGKVVSLPLPPMEQRFLITRRIIATLAKVGLEPERMRFKFEAVPDAGLTRQVASFTLKGRWSQIGTALARLQAADRSLYISRLRVSRQGAGDEQVSADVQLAVAMVDRAGEDLPR